MVNRLGRLRRYRILWLTGVAAGAVVASVYLIWRQPVMLTRVPLRVRDSESTFSDKARLGRTFSIALLRLDSASALAPIFTSGKGEPDSPGFNRLKKEISVYSSTVVRDPLRIVPSERDPDELFLVIRSAPIRDKAAVPEAVDRLLQDISVKFGDRSAVTSNSDSLDSLDPAVEREMVFVKSGIRKVQVESDLYRLAAGSGISPAALQTLAAGVDDRDPGALATALLGAVIAAKGGADKLVKQWGPRIVAIRIAFSDDNANRVSIRNTPYARFPALKVSGEPVFEYEIARDLALFIVSILVGGGLGLLTGAFLRPRGSSA